MFGIMHHLNITVCKDAADAIAKGFDYKNRKVTPVNITDAVVVQNGTVGGHSTVDFVMVDEAGNKYAVMVTGRLLKGLSEIL